MVNALLFVDFVWSLRGWAGGVWGVEMHAFVLITGLI